MLCPTSIVFLPESRVVRMIMKRGIKQESLRCPERIGFIPHLQVHPPEIRSTYLIKQSMHQRNLLFESTWYRELWHSTRQKGHFETPIPFLRIWMISIPLTYGIFCVHFTSKEKERSTSRRMVRLGHPSSSFHPYGIYCELKSEWMPFLNHFSLSISLSQFESEWKSHRVDRLCNRAH